MDNSFYKRTSSYLWQIVLIVVGVSCLVISISVTQGTDKAFATFNSLGVSLLLSGTLGLFMNMIVQRKDMKYRVCEEWGIRNIYETRTIANITIDAYQERAREKIDIIAFGLGSWRQEKERLIDSMLAQNVKIRIITVDPNNEILKMRDRAEGKQEGSTRESILQLKEFFNNSEPRKAVKIKYHKELPLDFYFRVDDHVFVGPYIFGRESQKTITYEFEKGGEGFSYYTEYFEKLWEGKSIPSLETV